VTIGNVAFTDGSASLGTAALNASGVATLSATGLAVGSHTITATYTGTLNFSPSSATLTEGVVAPSGAFTLTATPPSQYIRGAGTLTWQVTVTPSGSFAGPVALTCAGLPSDATCSFAQGTLTLAQGVAASTTMTTTTTVQDAALTQVDTNHELPAQWCSVFMLPWPLGGLGALLAGIYRGKVRGRRGARLVMFAVVMLGVLGLNGCNCFNTSYKTYTIAVTGTSTLGGPPPQSATVQLSVGLQ
jgi:hypothetical protein